MAYSRQSTSPDGLERVNSTSTRSSLLRSPGSSSIREDFPISLESPRARYQDQLYKLALDAEIPVILSKPLLSGREQRATPQNPSDRAAAEELLMSMRQKKFLRGKSSKGFANDEIMLVSS